MPKNCSITWRPSSPAALLPSRFSPFLPSTSERSYPFANPTLFSPNLPLGDCRLEYRFPSINRIADVAWLSQKIVFEIQYSPIKAAEILARNYDYQRQGWKIIWILHDQQYNQKRLSAAEFALRSSPHFFTNIDQMGSGMIYDHFDICQNDTRLKSLSPLPIDIANISILNVNQIPAFPLILLEKRFYNWGVSFEGDLMSLFLKNPHSAYLFQAAELEKKFSPRAQLFMWYDLLPKLWKWGIVQPYRVLFRFLLERMCR